MNRAGTFSAAVLGQAARPAADHRRAAYAIISALLRYPDEALVRDLPLLDAAIGIAPAAIRDQLLSVVIWVADTPLLEAQACYVETFDMRRKCCLYLSYYMNGDTRRRGEALWRFQDACRRAGFRVAGGELADYLPLLLELAACGGEGPALELLDEHRAGIELLGAGLRHASSPYAGLISALGALLPAAKAGTASSAARLMRDGPPTELVGVESPGTLSPCRPTGEGTEESERR